MKYVILVILLLHGLIHFMGFAKGWQLAQLSELTLPVSRPAALLWLVAGLILLAGSAMWMADLRYWPEILLLGGLLSTALILPAWQDARFGMLPNVLVLVLVVYGIGNASFERQFRSDVALRMEGNRPAPEMLTEQDLAALPEPVQRYLRYTGSVGKPKVHSVYVAFGGEMRARGKDYFPFVSEQYNFFDDDPARMFFMKGRLYGIQVPGYHRYAGYKASMDIRLFGLLSVVKHTDLFKAETVTLLNDMCFLAPPTLIDPRISWQQIDDFTVQATFTNKGVSVSATLFFGPDGQLLNFRSSDRVDVSQEGVYPWSTPIKGYIPMNGYLLPAEGQMIWHYPEEDFVYGTFRLRQTCYNPDAQAPE